MENINLNEVPCDEGQMSQPSLEPEIQPRISVTLSREAYDSLINDLTRYKARVVELHTQVERQNTEIRMLRMGRSQEMDLATRRQNEIYNQWLGTKFLLDEERRKNACLRATIAATQSQTNVNLQLSIPQNPPSVNQQPTNPRRDNL